MIATNVCFLFSINFFLKQIPNNATISGATILAVLKVYIDNTKETTDKTIDHFFPPTPCKKNKTPLTRKKVAIFASNAALDNIVCQGETAKNSEASNAYSSFDFESQKILFVKKYVTNTVNTPNKAAGNLTANSSKPKNLTGNIDKYAYAGGLKSPKDSK